MKCQKWRCPIRDSVAVPQQRYRRLLSCSTVVSMGLGHFAARTFGFSFGEGSVTKGTGLFSCRKFMHPQMRLAISCSERSNEWVCTPVAESSGRQKNSLRHLFCHVDRSSPGSCKHKWRKDFDASHEYRRTRLYRSLRRHRRQPRRSSRSSDSLIYYNTVSLQPLTTLNRTNRLMNPTAYIAMALENGKGWTLGLINDMKDAPLQQPTPNGREKHLMADWPCMQQGKSANAGTP
jgi:hypothetical protein